MGETFDDGMEVNDFISVAEAIISDVLEYAEVSFPGFGALMSIIQMFDFGSGESTSDYYKR